MCIYKITSHCHFLYRPNLSLLYCDFNFSEYILNMRVLIRINISTNTVKKPSIAVKHLSVSDHPPSDVSVRCSVKTYSQRY